MARIMSKENIRFCLWANSQLISDVKWKAHRMGIPINWIMTRAIKEYLDRNPRENEAEEIKSYFPDEA